jgi:hypothetical protein
MALYTTLKASHSRVSSAMMRKQGMSVQSVLSQGTTVNTSYWLVPISEGQPLAPALTKYKVPSELVAATSEGQVDLASWHVLDKACPREKLGLGVSEIVLHLKNDTRFLAGDSDPTGSGQAGVARGPQAAAAVVTDTSASARSDGAMVVAAPSAVSEAPQPPRHSLRQLTRMTSDDSDARDRRRRQVTADLVESVKKAAAEGRYSSPDATDATTVEFWARSVLETLEDAAQLRIKEQAASTSAAGLAGESAAVVLANSPIYKLFPTFLAKQLIGGKSFHSIPLFGAWFARLAATGAVVPPLAVLIQRLAKYEVTSAEAIDTEGVSLEDRALFFQSPLYKDFRGRRADAMLVKAKAANGEERIKI